MCTPCVPELPVPGWGVLLLIGDLALCDGGGVWSNWESGVDFGLGSSSKILTAGITTLRLAKLAWEEDEFALVGLETLHVGGEGWDRVVYPAVVNGDTNGTGESTGNLGFL